MSEAQGSVARDGARSVQDLRNAIGWHIDVSRQFSRAHIECLQFFSQVFTRMDSSECHSDALALAYQRFKTVARQGSKVGKVPQRRGRPQTVKLQRADRSNPENALTRFPGAKFAGPFVPIADDHYPRSTRYLKRKGSNRFGKQGRVGGCCPSGRD